MESRTILIVDDDRELAQQLELRCRELGLNVQVAHDSHIALENVRDGLPDLICVDLNMPNGDGARMGDLLTDLKRCIPIPIIVLTWRTNAATIEKCQELIAHFVLKCGDVWQRIEPLLHVPGEEAQSSRAIDQSSGAFARLPDYFDAIVAPRTAT